MDIYNVLKNCRDFGLKDQMTRAAVSIPSNIAEGSERDSKQEYIRFVHIAKGSAAELRTQLYIAAETGVLPRKMVNDLTTELKQISAMLHGIIKTLKKRQEK